MDQISKALNMKTEIFVGSDYNATIEALRSNKVDVALMGAFGYVLATTQAPVEAFAVTVTAKSNSPDYHSIIIARADAAISPRSIRSRATPSPLSIQARPPVR